MSEFVKKAYKLKNLNCPLCADRIETLISELNGVKNAGVNFASQRLYFEMQRGMEENIIPQIYKICFRVNEEVVLDELMYVRRFQTLSSKKNKTLLKTIDRIYSVKNLGCPACATKIERKIRSMDSVQDASLDLVSKKLFIKLEESKEDEIIAEISKIADKIEPGTVFEPFKKRSSLEEEKEVKKEKSKKNFEILKLISSIALFFTGILFFKESDYEVVFLITAYFISGYDVVYSAIRNLTSGQIFDEKFLMTIASLGAIVIGQYEEAVAVMIFYFAGEFMQSLAVEKSRKSIKDLMDINPEFANVVRGENILKVFPEEVGKNEIIVIRPGEKIPLDGVVIEGNTTLDTRSMTGESKPKFVDVGDEVISGTVNLTGLIKVEVLKEFSDSAVANILDLVENAGNKKAKAENFITQFAKYYTPIVVALAALIAVIPPLVLNNSFAPWIYRAMIFLVISCPCALVISVPLTYFAGIGSASKNGILVKGGNYLDALTKVKNVLFDKTGTLTKGNFKISEINAYGMSKDELLELACAVEYHSSHPIALSIKEEYGKKPEIKIEDMKNIAGRGIFAKTEKGEVLLGNAKLLTENNIKFQKVDETANYIYLSLNGEYIGNIQIKDEIKEESYEMVKNLKGFGFNKLTMLTGDNKVEAEKIANDLNIEYRAELLPDQKVSIIEDAIEKGTGEGNVVFVGDGINDAPALIRSDVGIAMGEVGSDAAVEAADVIIMGDDMNKITSIFKIAKKTRRIVLQNIIFAIGVKILVLGLGAFGLANMWAAVFADVGVSIIAVLNAMRALKL